MLSHQQGQWKRAEELLEAALGQEVEDINAHLTRLDAVAMLKDIK